jgi:ATP-binding cassette subfamily B protein
VLDGVLSPHPERAGPSTHWVLAALGGREHLAENLWLPGLAFLGLSALAGAFTYLRSRWAADASESIVRRVRDQVYDHLQRLPCATLDQADTGDLIQRCTSDVETLRKFLASQVVEIGRAVIMLVVPIPLMLSIDARMTAVSLLLVGPICLFSFVVFRHIKATFLAADEAEGRLTSRIQENLTGIRVVRAFARQDHEEALFGACNREHRDLDYRLYQLLARFWACSDLLCFVQQGLVVGAGLLWVSQGTLLVGAFFYFLTAVNLFVFPVRQLGRILTDLGKAVVGLERLEEILSTPQEADPEQPSGLERLGGGLSCQGLGFAHGAQQVLEAVTFELRQGQTLALLGPSGSGKSTLIELLLRLHDPQQGRIRLGGHELRALERGLVRRQAAVVLQQPFLFSKTLADNIRLGRPQASQAEVEEAARLACVHESILGFEEGYATRVGERGVTLSGGQRQRIALARALLQEPTLLILDDALSAVDTATEAAILEGMRGSRAEHTTVVVAHRVSTVMHADLILVLEGGRVVQRGDHRSLSALDGPYSRMWRAQSSQPLEPAAVDLLARSA